MKDFSGFRLEDAAERLKAQGYEVTVRLTASPGQRDRGYDADSRSSGRDCWAEKQLSCWCAI